ncbi:hypothetical protein VTP01DRAFT_2449 [Rhizomucor pusillus]|uniref:uncharacterized protein n=1 Tax=Rhizomucor pusillus TaxID=4840 RepID=UPI003742E9D5
MSVSDSLDGFGKGNVPTRVTEAEALSSLWIEDLQNERASALVDPGANFSTISSSYAKEHRIKIHDRAQPIQQAVKGHVAQSVCFMDPLEIFQMAFE